MFFSPEMIAQFFLGASAGLGQTFGRLLIPWMLNSWNWIFGKSSTTDTSKLIRKTTAAAIRKSGVPEGFLAYQKDQHQWKPLKNGLLSADVPDNQQLWLFPTGNMTSMASLKWNDMDVNTSFDFEFSPEHATDDEFLQDHDFDQHWMNALMQGTLLGILESLDKNVTADFFKGEPSAVQLCTQKLKQELKSKGITCHTVQPLVNGTSSQSKEMDLLTQQVAAVSTPGEWQQIVNSIKQAGAPIDPQAEEKLAAMQDQVISKHISPEKSVKQLAEITKDAFDRAGIGHTQLKQWQNISETLADADEKHPTPESADVKLAIVKRPGTWFVWSRQEVDKRQLLFTKRVIRNSRIACEQAMNNLRDIKALRELRDLKEQLLNIEELLTTIPPLEQSRSSLKLDKETIKSLLASYSDAVKSLELFAAQLDILLESQVDDPNWISSAKQSRQLLTKISQYIRDRRQIR